MPIDTISEFKVVLNPYDASYGRAGGGAVDVSLKSGTNAIHGSLYEFARRPWLDAQSYQYDYVKSQPGQTAPLPSRHQRDQFGLEMDGPSSFPTFTTAGTRHSSLLNGSRPMSSCPTRAATSIPFPTRNGSREIFPARSTTIPLHMRSRRSSSTTRWRRWSPRWIPPTAKRSRPAPRFPATSFHKTAWTR